MTPSPSRRTSPERSSHAYPEDLDGVLDGRRGRRDPTQDSGRPRLGIPAVAGGGPFEMAVAQRALPAYLELCAEIGLTESSAAKVSPTLSSRRPTSCDRPRRDLEVEFELGEKHGGRFTDEQTDELIATGHDWLAGGRRRLVSRRVRARRTSACFRPRTVRSRQAERSRMRSDSIPCCSRRPTRPASSR